ncbi:lovastatin nonaketide synthase, partial [Colletotrichum higginsianum]
MAQRNYPNEPVVIVGSGCRFPGAANTPSKLWDLLKEPRDVQSRIPKERFDVDTFYHPDGTHHGRTNASYAYFLKEDLHAFDAPFFNIQAGEAESMDPQQRLLLETVYEAVSNAGMRMQDLQGSSTAVYVGMMTHDYETTSTRDLESIPTYSATGVAVSIASNRISYFFDWHGPSMTIDTACSSSLAAVHLAVQQLRSGQSTMAVAAGANLILGPMTFVLESKLNMLSPSGRSRMWDAGADGYARGEAVCSVVLKTLSQALKDGDTIECVIRETGINQDGRTTGITMPNHDAQEALIRATYARAGLDINNPQERCQFFEAHGTGTPAGDPQEANAIASAFFGQGDNSNAGDDPLFVGSIKTIVGHTEGTAGIAGLLKACLAVKHGVIPPNLLFNKLSPRVAPFYNHLKITTEAIPWPTVAPGQPRRVSVNSFGFGGTNAHAIVEEYLGPDQSTPLAEPV